MTATGTGWILGPVFSIMDLGPAGPPTISTALDAVAPPSRDVVRWVDLVEPDAESLALLRERFDLHPLAIEDCASFGLQSKIDDYGRYLFVVVHSFTAAADDPLGLQIHEIHAFISDNCLITVHDNPLAATERVWDRAQLDRQTLERGPAWILYQHVDAMVEATEPLVTRIRDRLDELESQVIEEKAIELPQVFEIKRTAVAMRRVMRPLRDTLGILLRRNDPRVSPRTMLHMRDVADHVARLSEMVEETREVAIGVVASYHAVEAQKAGQVVKRLTVFSAVFLPLTFIVGFFGQNFAGLPYHSAFWQGLMLASLVLVPAGLMEWFRRNWL